MTTIMDEMQALAPGKYAYLVIQMDVEANVSPTGVRQVITEALEKDGVNAGEVMMLHAINPDIAGALYAWFLLETKLSVLRLQQGDDQ